MHRRRTHLPGRVLIALLSTGFIAGAATPLHAQRLVDPSKVAPEFRDAAEKRRAEQFKIMACNKSVQDAKVNRRDFAKALVECYDKPDDKMANKPK